MLRLPFAAVAVTLLSLPLVASPQVIPGRISSHQKLSAIRGGFQAFLGVNDQIGRAVTCVGDIDGDGIDDLATAGHGDDDGGEDKGAVYLLLMKNDGTVRETKKISERFGNFGGDLDVGDQFGRAIGRIGDLDGDGVPDLAVGSSFDDDGGLNRGAIYILFLASDGSVRETTKISSTSGGFAGELDDEDEFGRAFAPLGDFDGDGTLDLAVGSPYDDDGAWNAGAIWLLYLNPDGTVKSHGKISQTQGSFGGIVGQLDYFGWSLDSVDLDGDGILDIVTGEVLDDHSTLEYSTGAIWWLFMNADGTVRDETKVNQTRGGFTGDLDTKDQFGVSLAVVGDLDGDLIPDLAVGAVKDDDGGTEQGAIWILFQNRDGTVKGHYKISEVDNRFPEPLQPFDWLASSLAGMGDHNGDGIPDLVAGARFDDDGLSNGGALYVLFLEGLVAPPEADFQASTRSGEAPLEVEFTDLSRGPITSWSWSFGDGAESFDADPTHTYTTPGTYMVSLDVTGPGGSDLVQRGDWIRVSDPDLGGQVAPYGCGGNPDGSLVYEGGEPRPGGRLTFGATNPLGTQNPGTIPRIAISLAPDAAYPCGSPRANFGMEFAGAPGSFLIDPARIVSIVNGPPWAGPGTTTSVTLTLPGDPGLIGTNFYLQGLLIDRNPSGGPRVGLTTGFEIRVGP